MIVTGHTNMITQDNKTKPINAEELEDLQLLAGKTIGELSSEKFPGLLVFPRDFNASEDLDKDTLLYSIEVKDKKHQLVTNNIVGFIGFENTQLTIRSRFAEENEEDYFLHYMLQKVLSLNIIELKHKTADEQILDFLIYLFPSLLKRAVRQGIFKEYQNRAYDNANIKGRINVSKFIQKDIPFAGHIAYNTREYCADNSMNQLIRHTIEYIKDYSCGQKETDKKIQIGRNLLSVDEETKQAVSLIIAQTPAYQRRNRLQVINKNLKAIRHPYYSAYLPLQRLCLQILRHQGLKYGQANQKIQGVLFDAAWLWEEYLNTLLKPLGYEHPQNKKNQGAIYLFSNNRYQPRFPDFYKENMVLDAKYKYAVTREDYHQMITYLYIRQGEKGIFLSPESSANSAFQSSSADNHTGELYRKHLGKLNGYGGELQYIHLSIPTHCETYTDFCQRMKKQEELLQKNLAFQ